MSSKVRVGVIGTGRIGKLHVNNLSLRIPESEVVAVSDIMMDSAQKTAAYFDIAVVEKNPHDLIKRADIDAVIICSSTETHAEFISKAAEEGKHIFCEKPVALKLMDIDKVLDDVDAAGVMLMIGFNRRYDANYSRIREHILNRTIGDLHMIKITSRDPAPPPMEYLKSSGGLFMDMMIHDFDMVRYLTGAEVDHLFVEGAVLVDKRIGDVGDIDTAVVVMKMKNGVMVTIDNSRKAVYGHDQRVEAFGSKGMAATENNRPNNVRVSGTDCVYEDLPYNFFMERYSESYYLIMKEFIESIKESKKPPVTGFDSRVSVVIANAAKKSLDTKEVVYLD